MIGPTTIRETSTSQNDSSYSMKGFPWEQVLSTINILAKNSQVNMIFWWRDPWWWKMHDFSAVVRAARTLDPHKETLINNWVNGATCLSCCDLIVLCCCQLGYQVSTYLIRFDAYDNSASTIKPPKYEDWPLFGTITVNKSTFYWIKIMQVSFHGSPFKYSRWNMSTISLSDNL